MLLAAAAAVEEAAVKTESTEGLAWIGLGLLGFALMFCVFVCFLLCLCISFYLFTYSSIGLFGCWSAVFAW